ncbi:hypothetical protein GCM10010335_37040 [Streptomyces galbus]|nr:hypothetical protein GCM10010335_37040 [Streptomyces galbus]
MLRGSSHDVRAVVLRRRRADVFVVPSRSAGRYGGITGARSGRPAPRGEPALPPARPSTYRRWSWHHPYNLRGSPLLDLRPIRASRSAPSVEP